MASITLRNIQIQDPPLTKILLTDPRTAWFWAILRIWLGYQWIDASLHKIGVPAWTETGAALKGFWIGAVAVPAEGRPPISFDWYRGFIQLLLDGESYVWFGKFVAYGEMIIGIALVIDLRDMSSRNGYSEASLPCFSPITINLFTSSSSP